MKIPLIICLFTSTKGHWGIRTRYLETINHLNNQIPLNQFAGLVSHIKVSPGEDDVADEMVTKLENFGFTVLATEGEWAHRETSHQLNYLQDLYKMYTNGEVLENQYVLHLEDDWELNPLNGKELIEWFDLGIKLLAKNPDILQVRFPRFADEDKRILGLKAKHNIDGEVVWNNDKTHFLTNDYSMNPSIFRGRDLRAAIILMTLSNQFEPHVEHGFGKALKLFARNNKTPLAVLNPEKIKAAHIGSPLGEEDLTTKPLYSN